jgi:hypothetical protein
MEFTKTKKHKCALHSLAAPRKTIQERLGEICPEGGIKLCNYAKTIEEQYWHRNVSTEESIEYITVYMGI